MRNSLLVLTMLAAFGIADAQAVAAEVKVTFEQPEKYTDIRPTHESRSRYEQKVLQSVEKIFTDLAAKMPEGYQWQVTVTDIDLAGDVDYFAGPNGQALRIVKDIYSPAVRFSHSLRDNYGEEVLSGEEKLRDMAFLQRLSKTGTRAEFEHEQVMLQDWFNKTVQPAVTQHAAVAPKVSN